MLEDLSIKDFAIIESEHIEFSNGFTVLSGETGAGKSILIGAMSFLLGGKADVNQIRSGAHEAQVSGTFYLDSKENQNPALEWLNDHGIETENNRILLRRYIRDNGRAGAWIGSTPVNRTDLAEFSSFLVDIHGQHEHQSLMRVPEHRKFLDARAGILPEVSAFTALYMELVEKRRLLAQLDSSDADRTRKIDMYNFAVKEIEDAKLKPEEDIQLEEEENRLSSYEKLFAGVDSIRNMLDGGDESVVSLLKKIRRESQNISILDKTLSSLDTRIESAFYELNDISEEFASYANKLVYDPSHLQEVQDRLSLIYSLKKKYASSQSAPLKEVFDYYENAQKSLEQLGAGSENREELMKSVSELEKKVYLAGKNLSEKRRATGDKLASEVEALLKNLGMNGTRFAVSITAKPGDQIEQKCGPYGFDNIEFLISANPGSPLLPLAKIASGGEISRVMLALKTIFAQNDPVQTLVFDEIDTGIGGEVAVAVGSHMKALAKNRQIFCITHLASIAVYADNQIKIEKGVAEGKTVSNVHPIQGEERVSEIARMLSGDADSAASIEHARAMLEKYSGGF
ncbi:MAG: DNA repair protein RecN [Treponema sp.]|nr:MAG: DNA repair protein RecN [Treponema sp.]